MAALHLTPTPVEHRAAGPASASPGALVRFGLTAAMTVLAVSCGVSGRRADRDHSAHLQGQLRSSPSHSVSHRAQTRASVQVQIQPRDSGECYPAPVCPGVREVPTLEGLADWGRINAILHGPEQDIDPAELNLLVAHSLDRSVNVHQTLMQLAYMASTVRVRFGRHCDDACKIAHLNNYLFVEEGYAAEFDPSGLYNRLERDMIHSVLETRMGYCEGLTYLYIALGQRLGLRLNAVAARQHMYVRYTSPNGSTVDIDTTMGGRRPVLTSRCEAFAGVYGQTLSPKVLAARILGVLGISSDVRSLAWLREATRWAPGAPELRHNYGLALARHGQIAEALDEFRAARMLDPCVPLFAVNEARQLWALGHRDQADRLVDLIAGRVERGAVAEGGFFVSLVRAGFAFERNQDEVVEQYLRDAVTESDTAPAVLEAVSTIRTIQGRGPDAVAAMRAAVRRHPTIRTRAGLLQAFLGEGMVPEASRQLQRIEQDSVGTHGTLDLLRAQVFAAQSATDLAHFHAQRCLRDHGRDCSRALVVLGDVAHTRGENVCARRYYEAFLSCPQEHQSRALVRAREQIRQRIAALPSSGHADVLSAVAQVQISARSVPAL